MENVELRKRNDELLAQIAQLTADRYAALRDVTTLKGVCEDYHQDAQIEAINGADRKRQIERLTDERDAARKEVYESRYELMDQLAGALGEKCDEAVSPSWYWEQLLDQVRQRPYEVTGDKLNDKDAENLQVWVGGKGFVDLALSGFNSVMYDGGYYGSADRIIVKNKPQDDNHASIPEVTDERLAESLRQVENGEVESLGDFTHYADVPVGEVPIEEDDAPFDGQCDLCAASGRLDNQELRKENEELRKEKERLRDFLDRWKREEEAWAEEREEIHRQVQLRRQQLLTGEQLPNGGIALDAAVDECTWFLSLLTSQPEPELSTLRSQIEEVGTQVSDLRVEDTRSDGYLEGFYDCRDKAALIVQSLLPSQPEPEKTAADVMAGVLRDAGVFEFVSDNTERDRLLDYLTVALREHGLLKEGE